MQIKPNQLCELLPGHHAEPMRTGMFVMTVRYIGDWFPLDLPVAVFNAWEVEANGAPAWVSAPFLKPISDPDSLTDADKLDENLLHEYQKRVAA